MKIRNRIILSCESDLQTFFHFSEQAILDRNFEIFLEFWTEMTAYFYIISNAKNHFL